MSDQLLLLAASHFLYLPLPLWPDAPTTSEPQGEGNEGAPTSHPGATPRQGPDC